MSLSLPVVAQPLNPHFARLGGEAAVVRLVDAFYDAMDRRPEAATIRAMHATDLGPTRALLVDYLCEWLGGPRRYSARRGAPRLRRAHAHFAIDAAARDAWMDCMRHALDTACDDAALRGKLAQAFARIAEHLRNDGGSHPPHPSHVNHGAIA